MTLRIPAGVETGSRLRVAGKGEGGTQGGQPGDLYVILHVRPHAIFRRQDEDIFCEVPVPFNIAALGGEVEVPTIHGSAKLKLPAGTPSGKVFRLRGKGVPGLHGYRNGDQHTRVVVEVPSSLTGQQKRLLHQWGDSVTTAQYPQRRRLEEQATRFYEHKRRMGK